MTRATLTTSHQPPRHRMACFAALVCASWMTLSAEALSQDGEPETFEYTIQKGDTCAKIAKRMFGNKYRWDIIHKYNPNMGPTPHSLKPGETLTLPRLSEKPDAQLTAVRRQVQTREPKQSQWQSASVGKDLYRGWRVNTLERSAAEVTFRDNSAVQMRENTLIIIYGGGSTYRTARRRTSEATLERGALRSRLSEFRLKVRTPSAEADLERGSSVVSVGDDGTSQLSNHEGGAATFKVAKGKAKVRVKPGFGSKIKKGAKKPAPPKRLPKAPVWENHEEQVYAGFDGVGASATARWKPSKQADYYRIEITREGGERTTIAAATVPSSVHQFEIHRLPEGVYQARISTIDRDNFESKPAKPLWIDVRSVALDLPGNSELTQVDPDKVYTKPPRPRVLAGTKVRAPETFICGVDGIDAGAEIQLTEPGRLALLCRGERTKIREPLEIEVVQPTVTLRGNQEPPAVTRGESVRVPINVESDIPLPTDLRFVAPEGVTVRADELKAIEVAAQEGAPDSFVVDLVAGEGGDAVTLGSVPMSAVDPPPPPEPIGRAYAPQEALGLALSANAMGLRDDRREGSGVWLNISSNGEGPSADGYWRASLGVEVAPVRRLRLGVASALDIRTEGVTPARRGDRDLLTWAGYRILADDDWSLYAEMAAWIPLGPDPEAVGRVRLAPSLELSRELAERVLLRTRQGAIIALRSSGLNGWASAYGVDIKIVRRLTIGAEFDLVVGRAAGETVIAPALGGGISVLLGPAALQFGVRGALANDFEALVGKLTLSTGVRISWGE